MDLRCPHKKHAELHEGVLEIKCSSRFCGVTPGTVVIHRWDALTGERLDDKRYRDPISPARSMEEGNDHDDAHPVAVRSS